MAAPPAVVSPPPLGSTRNYHAFLDWCHAGNNTPNNFGGGQGLPWQVDRANLAGQSAAGGGAWSSLSGVNKVAGRPAGFLGATSFNVGEFSNYVIPCVGGNPHAAVTLPAAENQQYWSWNFILAQGDGVAQSGFTPINPPFTTITTADVGVFFFCNNFGRSASSYGQFSDNGGPGSEAGAGVFLDTTGAWRYGIRYQRTGAAHPLDVNVALTPGTGVGQWPVPIIAGVPDYAQYVQLTVQFLGAVAAGPSGVKLALNGKGFVNTTLANIGVAPTGVGLASQWPDFFQAITSPADPLDFGIVGCIRCGPGTGSPVQTFPLSFNQIEFCEGPLLSSTFPLGAS